jgi:hypothetical protein
MNELSKNKSSMMIECLSDQQSNSDIVALSLFFHGCPLWHSASMFANHFQLLHIFPDFSVQKRKKKSLA